MEVICLHQINMCGHFFEGGREVMSYTELSWGYAGGYYGRAVLNWGETGGTIVGLELSWGYVGAKLGIT